MAGGRDSRAHEGVSHRTRTHAEAFDSDENEHGDAHRDQWSPRREALWEEQNSGRSPNSVSQASSPGFSSRARRRIAFGDDEESEGRIAFGDDEESEGRPAPPTPVSDSSDAEDEEQPPSKPALSYAEERHVTFTMPDKHEKPKKVRIKQVPDEKAAKKSGVENIRRRLVDVTTLATEVQDDLMFIHDEYAKMYAMALKEGKSADMLRKKLGVCREKLQREQTSLAKARELSGKRKEQRDGYKDDLDTLVDTHKEMKSDLKKVTEERDELKAKVQQLENSLRLKVEEERTERARINAGTREQQQWAQLLMQQGRQQFAIGQNQQKEHSKQRERQLKRQGKTAGLHAQLALSNGGGVVQQHCVNPSLMRGYTNVQGFADQFPAVNETQMPVQQVQPLQQQPLLQQPPLQQQTVQQPPLLQQPPLQQQPLLQQPPLQQQTFYQQPPAVPHHQHQHQQQTMYASMHQPATLAHPAPTMGHTTQQQQQQAVGQSLMNQQQNWQGVSYVHAQQQPPAPAAGGIANQVPQPATTMAGGVAHTMAVQQTQVPVAPPAPVQGTVNVTAAQAMQVPVAAPAPAQGDVVDATAAQAMQVPVAAPAPAQDTSHSIAAETVPDVPAAGQRDSQEDASLLLYLQQQG